MVFGGKVIINAWFIPIVMFIKHIAFGGIEEIWLEIFLSVLYVKTKNLWLCVMTHSLLLMKH